MSTTEEILNRIEALERENQELREQITQTQPVLSGITNSAEEQIQSVSAGAGVSRRRALLSLLAGGALIVGASGTVKSQANEPGAACTWLGDQNAAGYGLFGLGSLEGSITDNTEVTSITGTGLSITDGVLNSTSASDNHPDWTPDGNSPDDPAATQNYTYTIADTYDVYLVHVDAQNQTGSNQTISLQIDGNTDSNYGGNKIDGSFSSGNSSVQISEATANGRCYPVFMFMGRFGGRIGIFNLSVHDTGIGNHFQAATYQGTISSPASQFTLLGESGDFDYNIEVYGRDMG